jgi:hypothetical protein
MEIPILFRWRGCDCFQGFDAPQPSLAFTPSCRLNNLASSLSRIGMPCHAGSVPVPVASLSSYRYGALPVTFNKRYGNPAQGSSLSF